MLQGTRSLQIVSKVLFGFLIFDSLYPYPVWGSPYQSADHYWPMYNITDGILEDVKGAAHTVVYNGGRTEPVPQLGNALVLDGEDDWVDTGRSRECSSLPSSKFGCGFNADCVTNPSTCKEGFTMTFWLKVYSSGFIMSSGSFTSHRNGPGYRLFYKQSLQRFEFLLETQQKRWTLLLHEEIGSWTHMAFTWRDQSGLRYYEDGNLSTYTNKPVFLSPLRQQNYTPVITLARPNNLMRVREFGKFEISQLAIWLKVLSAEDIAGVYASGVTDDQKFVLCCHFKSVSPCVTDPGNDSNLSRKISESNERKCICPRVNLRLKTCTEKITGECNDKSSGCSLFAQQSRYCEHRKMRKICPRSCSYCAPPGAASTMDPTLATGSSSVSRIARESKNRFTVVPTNARPTDETSAIPTLQTGCGSKCKKNSSLATTLRPGYTATRQRMPRGESCDVLVCLYHAICEMTLHGYAECKCPDTCDLKNAPVCGSNEKTYQNMCMLKMESCLAGKWIRKFKSGKCGVPFGQAAHYWPLNGTTRYLRLVDVRGNSSAVAINNVGQSFEEQLGPVVTLPGKDEYIAINYIEEKCIKDPTYCTEGLSVAFWLKYTKGEFIISAGRYKNSDHGPGFRFICHGCLKKKGPHATPSGRFLLELSTETQKWKLIMDSVPKWWFHFAFTWTETRGLRFYENGKHVMSSTTPEPLRSPTRGEIPNDLTIGRPNSVLKINNYGQFSIGHLVIWTNELSSFDVEIAFETLLTKTIDSMKCCREMKVDRCVTNPCLNGATCQSMDDKYKCICSDLNLFRDCSLEQNLPEPCQDSKDVDCEMLARQEGYCRYHWRRMRNVCPKACRFCAWQAASKKEATTNLQLLQDPTPGSGTYQSSPATSTAPTSAIVGKIKSGNREGLSQTVFIVIMCSAIGGLVLLIIVLVYLFARFYRGRKGEFVPDKSYPHCQSKQGGNTGENGEIIPSFVDPSTPRITDVPHKPTRSEAAGRGAAAKKKKPMGVKITYKPPKWD